MKFRNLLIAIALGTLLSACGGSNGGPGTGTLNLEITDSPVDDADAVVVVFTGVEVKPVNGDVITIDYCDLAIDDVSLCKDIDLMLLQDGATTDLLNDEDLPAGEYAWIRLKVYTDATALDASYIQITTDSGSETHNLSIPSGNETGLKLVSGFTIAQGSIKRLVIDFDLRKSVLAPPGINPLYVLKPTLRIVDQQDSATIVGDVDLELLGSEQGVTSCVGGVYLFDGAGAIPDDQDGDDTDGADPVVYNSLEVDPVEGGTVASYTIPFVDAGDGGSADYTVAFTCNFDVDAKPDMSEYDPNAVSTEPGFETINWTTKDVTVVPGATETVSFLPPAP
jgi:hypothetical protein